eukprot:m.17854 g.17854  ORF g.17854 m.17854 type:complete len:744 (-) comp3540_c0_seq1:21-2252(-)
MDALTQCISEFVVSYDASSNVARLASGLVARLGTTDTVEGTKLTMAQLEKRFLCFRVTGHPDFKDAVFEGEVVCGHVTGRGHFLCDDGRVYKGHFVDGLCHGFCEMTAPEGVGGTDRLVKGPWKQGKVDGIAFVSSYDGSTFCGSYIGGTREGHGTWVSETDDRYVGGWKQNVRHGYGVLESGLGRSRYLGMWSSNEKNGRGVVVKPGLYYEGDFVADKLSGKGILVTDDDYEYTGEFSSDCHLQGKGKLKMPNGDYVEGVFKGRWQDRAGIQVTGTYFQHQSDAEDNSWKSKARDPLTTHLRQPCVPAEFKWYSIFTGCINEFEAEKPPPLDPDLAPSEIGPQILAFFKQTDHPLSRLAISLISALKAAYGSSTVTHHRLLSDLIVEIRDLSNRLDSLVKQFYPDHYATYASEHGHNGMREFLQQAIMLDELYPHVLFNLYKANFVAEEGAYANGVSRLNTISDVELFELFGLPRHLWLITPDRESQLRGASEEPLVTPTSISPIRTFDGSNIEYGFHALSPRVSNHLRASTSVSPQPSSPEAGSGTATPTTASRPRGVVPSVLAAWTGANGTSVGELSPMTAALESRASDLASLRAALASVSLDNTSETLNSALSIPPSASRGDGNGAMEDWPYAAAIQSMKALPMYSKPAEKLHVLVTVFRRMNEAVKSHVKGGTTRLGGMDDVLPAFLFILVRAAVPHLRSELQYLFDFTDFDCISGEKEIMLTTLRAGFFQLLKETKK